MKKEYNEEFIKRMLNEMDARFDSFFYYQFQKYVSEGYFQTNDEILDAVKKINNLIEDDKAIYYCLSKSKKTANVFNEHLKLIRNSVPLAETQNLTELNRGKIGWINKSYTLEKLYKLKDFLLQKYVALEGLKSFRNGNFYAETKRILKEKGV